MCFLHIFIVFFGLLSSLLQAMDPFDSGVWKHIKEGHFYDKKIKYKDVIINEKTKVISAEFLVKQNFQRKTLFPNLDETEIEKAIIRAWHNKEVCCSNPFGLSFQRDPQTDLYVGLFCDGEKKTAYPVLTYITQKQLHDAVNNGAKIHIGVFAKYHSKHKIFELEEKSYEKDSVEIQDLAKKGDFVASNGDKVQLKDISHLMDPKFPQKSILVEIDLP